MDFLAKGIPAKILGKDIGKRLCRDIDNTKAQRCNKMFRVLNEQLNEVYASLKANGLSEEEIRAHSEYDNLDSKITVFNVLYANGYDTPQKMKEEILRLFSDDTTGCVTLTTIHKSKGGEWDRVLFLGPELLPSKYCKTEKEFKTEDNLSYIAITRAKHVLFYMPIKKEKEQF